MDYVEAAPGDDPAFVQLVAKIVDSVDADDVRHLVVVRVDNWFDDKWVGFSGKGRVPFEGISPSHPGVSLDPFRQDQITFPPFSPKRILRESRFTTNGEKPLRGRIHRRVRQSSTYNLQRRVKDFSDSLVVVWFASATEENGRGSVMVYESQRGGVDCWYASFRRDGDVWKLARTKGIGRASVLRRAFEP
jgi:hypothetical protein